MDRVGVTAPRMQCRANAPWESRSAPLTPPPPPHLRHLPHRSSTMTTGVSQSRYYIQSPCYFSKFPSTFTILRYRLNSPYPPPLFVFSAFRQHNERTSQTHGSLCPQVGMIPVSTSLICHESENSRK